MATKKKTPAKKVAKPVKKAATKTVAKKATPKPAPKAKAAKPVVKAKPVAKPVKKAAKSIVKAKPVKKTVVKKATPKPAPKAKAAKPVAKATPVKKTVVKKVIEKKVVVKKTVVKKAEPKSTTTTTKAEVKKTEKPTAPKAKGHDLQALVSIKAKAKPVTKKEPPKPTKIIIPKTTTKSSVKYEPEFTRSVLDRNTIIMQQFEGPILRYSDNDLQEFREIIQRKLDAAKKELAYLHGLITRKDEGGDMDEARYITVEDGTVSMEREQLSQMASRQITFIDHLEKAMMRIENKTYGICRVTGKLIDKARLRAVPHATLSIEAKQGMNR